MVKKLHFVCKYGRRINKCTPIYARNSKEAYDTLFTGQKKKPEADVIKATGRIVHYPKKKKRS